MTYATFRDVIDAWPSRIAFANAIGASKSAVDKMYENDSIRGVYFYDIVRAAKDLRSDDQLPVTADDLCRLAGEVRSRKRAEVGKLARGSTAEKVA